MAEDIIIRYRAETDDLRKEIDGVIEKNEELQESVGDTDKSFKKSSASIVSSLSDEEKALQSAKKELDEYNKKVKQLSKSQKVDFLVKNRKEFEKLEKNVSDAKKALDGAAASTKKFASTGKKSLKGLASFATPIAGAIASAFAIDAVLKFSEASIDAFLDAEDAAGRLKFALEGVTEESDLAFTALTNQAKELQSVTKFSDNAIQGVQAQLANLGLTLGQIERITPKILDFSTQTGKSLEATTQLVASGIQGIGRELNKFNIDVSKSSGELDNFNTIVEGFSQFSGAAERDAQSLGGQIAILTNEYNDLQESVGEKLAPAFLRLKTLAFEALAGLLGVKKGLEELEKKADDVAKANITKGIEAIEREGGNTIEFLEKRIETTEKLNEEASKQGADLAKQREDELNRIIELNRLSSKEFTVTTTKELQDIDDKIEQNKKLNKVYERNIELFGVELLKLKEIDDQNKRNLSIEELKLKSNQELVELKEKEGEIDDLVSRQIIKNIDDILKARLDATKKASDAQRKAEQERLKALRDEFAASQSLFKQFEDEQKKRADLFAKTFSERIQITATTQGVGPALIQGESELIDNFKKEKENIDILVSTFEDKTKAAQVSAALTLQAETKLNEAIKKLYEDLGLVYRDNSAALNKLRDDDLEKEKLRLEQLKSIQNQFLEGLANSFSEISSLSSNFTNQRITDLQNQDKAYQESLENQREQLSEDRESRKITEAEFQSQIQELDNKSLENADRIRKEKNKLAKKQAIIDKAATLFQIAIATRQAYTVALAQPPGPPTTIPLAALALVLGGLQAASVLSTPIPQFAKGTKGKKGSGMALVGEEGPEMTYLHSGSKVLPAKQTKRYSEVFDAMYDNDFDGYVVKNFVTPALLAQKEKHKEQQNQTFASNIVNSMQGVTYYDLEASRKKGMNVNNIEDFARIVAKSMEVNTRRL